MFSLLLILFFSATGVTLNHPDWTFGGVEKQQQFSGNLPANWNAGGKADALTIAEFLRAKHGLHGTASDFQYQAGAGGLSFRAPGYSADVQFDKSGEYSVSVDAQGALAVANDFHKGRDSGTAWSWVIDVSGVFLVIVALTGLGIMLFLRKGSHCFPGQHRAGRAGDGLFDVAGDVRECGKARPDFAAALRSARINQSASKRHVSNERTLITRPAYQTRFPPSPPLALG